MICVSLGKISFSECLEIIKQVELAELRLDQLGFTLDQVRKIFSTHNNLIATFRAGAVDDEKRKTFLLEAISAGARYIDLDIDNDAELIREIRDRVKPADCQLIISYHNFDRTPELPALREIVNREFSQGAHIAKVACYCRHPLDNIRLLNLLSEEFPVVVCGLGPAGTISRVVAVMAGSPFTYASWEGTPPTAAGQLSYQRLKKIFKLLGYTH